MFKRITVSNYIFSLSSIAPASPLSVDAIPLSRVRRRKKNAKQARRASIITGTTTPIAILTPVERLFDFEEEIGVVDGEAGVGELLLARAMNGGMEVLFGSRILAEKPEVGV
ncbi:hypothetical protein BKA61DRAFT_572064 [Leptodontidium sp. MPI-SDFR-AT-0119]|nr:hypothetical protein BKA61DRAFT_572064 [Leptodontidium sp. MPI-SDFR-AT-0119]